MTEIVLTLYLVIGLFTPPVLLALWFFGLRRYIRKKGKTAITAISWGFSMWADWTVAWEIGRVEGKLAFSVKAFFWLHILMLIEIVSLFFLK